MKASRSRHVDANLSPFSGFIRLSHGPKPYYVYATVKEAHQSAYHGQESRISGERIVRSAFDLKNC
jgi:hypothetical protein